MRRLSDTLMVGQKWRLKFLLATWRITDETTFRRRLFVRRHALRMLRQTFVLVELPLPRLPARERQRLLSGDVCAEDRAQNNRPLSAVFHGARRKRARGAPWLCTKCGSNLFILAQLVPEMQGLWAGSLDDPNIFEPQINVWTRSAPAWSKIDPSMKRIDVAPNEQQFKALLDEALAS